MDDRVQQASNMRGKSMMDTYNKYWHPFGLLLTDMEKEGMSVNRSAKISLFTVLLCSPFGTAAAFPLVIAHKCVLQVILSCTRLKACMGCQGCH